MVLKVLFFASCRETVGKASVEIDLKDFNEKNYDTNWLISYLLEIFPDLRPLVSTLSIAINKSYVRGNVQLSDGDEIALLPPISGG